MRDIPFKADDHQITTALQRYAEDLLASGPVTVKKVAELAGLGQNIVAAIDKARLSCLYIDQTDQGPILRKSDTYSEYLAIDEFKLHNGHQYAIHIIDLESGHVLGIARSKKKQVVSDFIDHVGLDWMEHFKAVGCDMNSDFQKAFEEHCRWISIEFDHFHIVKNLNDKVIAEVGKEVQNNLIKERNHTAAKQLKRSKYLLMSFKATLESKDVKGRKRQY